MKIQLKEKHLCYIASHLSTIVLSQYFKLVADIRDKRNNGSFQPDDLIDVEIQANQIIEIYNQLGYKAEYLVSGINREMKQSLIAQFESKIEAYTALITAKPEVAGGNYSNLTQEEITIVVEAGDIQVINASMMDRAEVADAEIEAMITIGRNLLS